MDTARADILAARHRLEDSGWIPRNADAFRHLPPPPVAVWLGEAPEAASASCDAPPLIGAGWTLHLLGGRPQGCVDARWLDAADPAKVLARSRTPVMEPEEPYELEGFFGNVIFTNGHLVDGDRIALPDDAVAIANSVPLTDDGKLDSDASVWLLLG